MRVTISGATGLIGRALAEALVGRGDDVIALGREPPYGVPIGGGRAMAWDPLGGVPPVDAVDGVDAVVHLAGAPIADHRWTAAHKQRIRESRVRGTANLVEAFGHARRPPTTMICASGIDYYGDTGDAVVDESSPSGTGFLSRVCFEWEESALRAASLGVRVVLARSGIVLSSQGGALPKLVLPFRLFAGGPLGTGRQWMSWIHLRDEVGLLIHALDNGSITDGMNLVSPQPVRNAVFAAILGRVLHRPAVVPTPRSALALALGERVDVLLASHRVKPGVAERTEFAYRFPTLEPALAELLR